MNLNALILLALSLLAGCGGGDCTEVPCPYVDPLDSSFATCYSCDGDRP